MVQQHILLAFCWVLFCALHSIFAGARAKQKIKNNSSGVFKYYRLLYTLFAFASFSMVMVFQLSIASPLVIEKNNIISIIGILMIVLGGSIMGICIKKYFMSLSGLLTLVHEETRTATLFISGIHQYVRHPLYLGTFIFIWGLFLVYPYVSLFIADIIITLYTLYGIRLEEAKLLKEFGNVYLNYKQQVPALIPSLKALRK
jgi:protein-S-isoprenylcysteine O-methyltransferase Ste14